MQHELCLFRNAPDLVPSNPVPFHEEEEQKHVKRRLSFLYGCAPGRFPGSNPVSIERKDLQDRMQGREYLSGLKTDGVRYLLLLTMHNQEPRAIMINRRFRMWEIEVWAPLSFFEKESVLDGELVWERVSHNRLQQVFLVFDSPHIRSSLLSSPYSSRLDALHKCVMSSPPAELERTILEEDKIFLASSDMKMCPKRFVPVEMALSLWEERGSVRHRNDGMIFVEDTTLKSGGTDSSVLKWKPCSDITIDVLVRKDKVIVFSSGKEHLLDTVLLEGKKRNVHLKRNDIFLSLYEEETKDDIFECSCSFEKETVHLYPLRVRSDKQSPNDLSTVLKTLNNILEDLPIEEVCSFFKKDEADEHRDLPGVCGGERDREGEDRKRNEEAKRARR